MKKSGLFFRVLITGILWIHVMMVCAQQYHFLYLQHEKSVSFYVKYEGQIYRSSSQGYLILSKIPKASLTFYLGMEIAGQQELRFFIDSMASDRGFLIKNFGEKGWGLFDLQKATIQYENQLLKTDAKPGSKIYGDTAINDAFGNMLSDVTKDTTVKYVTIKKPEIKKDTLAVSKQPVVLNADTSLNNIKDKVLKLPQTEEKKQDVAIVKLLRVEDKVDYQVFVFQVPLASGYDTVSVEIQKVSVEVSGVKNNHKKDSLSDADRQLPLNESNNVNQKENLPVVKDTVQVRMPNETDVPKQQVLIASESDVTKRSTTEVIVPMVSDSMIIKKDTLSVTPVILNEVMKSDCKRIADEEGFIRLRKRMAGRRTEDQMIEEAIKGFKQNCFTTQHIAQLSGLFVSDEMRYRFFDASLKFVSDPSQFSSLGKLIQDPYFKKRFEALVPNP